MIKYKNKTEGIEKVLVKAIEFLKTIYLCLGFTITRSMTLFLKETCKRHLLVGVEIGTLEGKNAKNIMKNLEMKILYLVDPYIKYSEYHDFEHKNIDDDLFNNARYQVKKYGMRVKFIRKFSTDAINYIPNNLDFVYIDANHDYEYVKKDIELYYPKVKNGGIIGGHNFDVRFNDVCKAVIEFAERNNLKIYGYKNDWWFIKTN